MLSNKQLMDCAVLKTPEKAFEDIYSCYVYSFINKDTNRFYIGSTINPVSRLHNYTHPWNYGRQGLLSEMRTTGGGLIIIIFFFRV